MSTQHLDTIETANLIGVNVRTLANWRCRGQGPHPAHTYRGRVFYAMPEVIRWIATHRPKNR